MEKVGTKKRRKLKCANCGKIPADKGCRLGRKRYCRVCAHNFTHLWSLTFQMLKHGVIPCPVFDGDTGQLIPFGTYPNIDYS